jgi:nucleoside-diphosphate-sugar epimerase
MRTEVYQLALVFLKGVRILVTGSSGHLGEALMRVLPGRGHDVSGLDILDSPFTNRVGSIADRVCARDAVAGVGAVVHAATLHKPHVGTHTRAEFVDTNITGTLNLLEEAIAANVSRFVFISTTSTFGRALQPADGEPAAWITEEVKPVPRNIYGTTKNAAEDLCEVIHHEHGLPCLVLKTSRFFPEPDDRDHLRATYEDLNVKVNELLYRRVDVEDIVDAVELALERAPAIGFGRYIISATSPFTREDLNAISIDLPAVVRRMYPGYEDVYRDRGWSMFRSIERVYENERARRELGWEPHYGFEQALDALVAGGDPRSELARSIGAKGYHARSTGVYTVR